MKLRIILAVASLWLSGVFAVAQAQASPESVIRDQIAAFQKDDFATAFGYASPMIRQMFKTPENFGGMVRQGYPMVWRPGEVAFGEQRPRGSARVQRVIITDLSGVVHVFDYELVPGENGWKINGVYPVTAPQVGA